MIFYFGPCYFGPFVDFFWTPFWQIQVDVAGFGPFAKDLRGFQVNLFLLLVSLT